ncbi:MAG: glycosyltransferase [Candidatus Aminicenantes bacterium]|nr:glycosyltransferase [Candidatus Aminicenantes bacterium]
MNRVVDYYKIVGDEAISSLYQKARRLYGRHIIHFNSTFQGGGVAEILVSLLPLMNDIGLDVDWNVLHGRPDFFTITKKFHNALQGDKINLTEMKKRLYTQASEDFSVFTHIRHDCVVIHDPQPLPLIMHYKKRQPWVWRCHIDLSGPNPEIWDYLKRFILRYDAVIVSSEKYRKLDLPIQQRIIPPAIDPLASKNKELATADVNKYLKKFTIPTDKPLLTQVSRFDRHKDPEGVLRVFEQVRKKVDCRLVLCGSMAPDDPEGLEVFERIEAKARGMTENGDVILKTVENDILVNVLQGASTVIIQKSKKEGFGLTVTEALWKKKPVVASNVGGIPLQITDGESGFLVAPNDENTFARRILQILETPALAERLGKNGHETVKRNFLITRLLSDHLELYNDIIHS